MLNVPQFGGHRREILMIRPDRDSPERGTVAMVTPPEPAYPSRALSTQPRHTHGVYPTLPSARPRGRRHLRRSWSAAMLATPVPPRMPTPFRRRFPMSDSRPSRSTASSGVSSSSATPSTRGASSRRPVRRRSSGQRRLAALPACVQRRDGRVISSFQPELNGQVRGIASSADGSVIYVVGNFTTAGGKQHQRIAALSAATGAPIAGSTRS